MQPTESPDPGHILQTGLAFWASKTLLSAVEMEVFTELARHPEDLETLRGRLGLHPRSARDFFDALVALGFLDALVVDVGFDLRRPFLDVAANVVERLAGLVGRLAGRLA